LASVQDSGVISGGGICRATKALSAVLLGTILVTSPGAGPECGIGPGTSDGGASSPLNRSGQSLEAIVWPTIWHLLHLLGALLPPLIISNPEGSRLVLDSGCTCFRIS
jgi:hypothetical protein